MINIWFKFEGNIQNDSKVITFTRNHTKDDKDVVPKTMSPPVEDGGAQFLFLMLKMMKIYFHSLFYSPL